MNFSLSVINQVFNCHEYPEIRMFSPQCRLPSLSCVNGSGFPKLLAANMDRWWRKRPVVSGYSSFLSMEKLNRIATSVVSASQ